MSRSSRKKKEITVLLNQVLGTSIAWHKLNMGELEQLVNLFTNPDDLYQKLKTFESEGSENEFSRTREALKKVALKVGVKILENWDGPIITYLKELLK